MLKRSVSVLVLACLVWLPVVGCAPSHTATRSKPPVERVSLSEHRQIIEAWQTQFDAADYPGKIKLLSTFMGAAADAEETVLSTISMMWEFAISTDIQSPSQAVAGAVRTNEESGWADVYNMWHETASQSMRELRTPPPEYSKAHDLLSEVFSTYTELPSLPIWVRHGACSSLV